MSSYRFKEEDEEEDSLSPEYIYFTVSKVGFHLEKLPSVSNRGPFPLPENQKTANLVYKSSLWHVVRICCKMKFLLQTPPHCDS